MRKTAYGYAHARLLILVAGILVAATAHTAVAANATTYTTRADFDAAAGPTRVVDFATDDFGNPLTDPSDDVRLPFLGLSGVCFQDVNTYWNLSIYTYPNAAITVDLPSGTYAIGTDLTPFYPIGGTHTVTLSTGEVFQFAANLQIQWSFFGVVSDTPIDWVTFTYDNTYLVLDNFAITSTAGPGRGCPPPPFIPVEIDIKPGSYPNSINPRSKGVIPVAILTTEDFAAATVDATTVTFGAGPATKAHASAHLEDVDGDGDIDMMLHFGTQEAGILCGEAAATLTGATLDGHQIEGSDSIKTVGCK